MKCCECQKSVDVEKNIIPPEWYGKYIGGKLIRVICAECIAKPENSKDWHKD
jgi:hypothetical protein